VRQDAQERRPALRSRGHWCAAALGGVLLLATAPTADAQLARDLGLIPADTAAAAADLAILPIDARFARSQLQNSRVMDARLATRFEIKRLFHERGIRYPAAEVFLRIFKRERSLELWVRPEGEAEFALLKTYAICALAGELGPKRKQGDAQVPEGFYAIDFFNPRSDFLLSLHLDYPNNRDRVMGADGVDLGGEIFIHGGCNSEGCLAVTDDGIRELYWMAVEARAAGQQRIPVHIFPARLGDDDLHSLTRAFADRPDLPEFWSTLQPGYAFFEEHRRLPRIRVSDAGTYLLDDGTAESDGPLGTPVRSGGDTAGSGSGAGGNGGAGGGSSSAGSSSGGGTAG
jgi:murein L,D-transpeptidase YafK